MKKTFQIAVVATALTLMLIPDVIYAQAGRMHRATRRRTAVVVGSATAAAGSAQTSQTQQEAAAANAAAAGKLPLGAVVTTLPAGCGSKTADGVQYYQCGGNYYRSAF